jgi:hypothetical protein
MDLSSLPSFQPANTGTLSSVTPLGSFGRGAASMLPLGTQAYSGIASLAEHKPYAQERQEVAQEEAQDKDINPGSRLAGQAAGVIAPIVATAGLAAPETLLGAAGQGALVGGGFGAGNAIDTLAGGGSGTDAAKDVAAGAGLGALGGAAGEGLGALAGKGASTLADTGIGRRLHVENISKALGLSPGALKTLGKNSGDTPEVAAQHIWSDLKGIPDLPSDFVSPMSNINDKLAVLNGLKEQAGQTIGAARKAGGEATAGNFSEGMEAAKDLVSQAENYVGIPDGSQENIKAIAAQLQAAESMGKLNFDQMSKIRSAVGNQVRSGVPGSHQVYRTLSQHLDNSLDRLGDTAGIDKPAFQTARKTYSTTSKLIPLMARGAGREASGTGGGLSNLLGIGGTLMGHPAAAAAPVAHEVQKIAAPELIHNLMLGGLGGAGNAVGGALPKAGAQIAASQAPTDVPLNHPAMAPWRPQFAQAAANAANPAEVKKSQAVTDFKLSQTVPAFSESKQKAAEETANSSRLNMADGGTVPDQVSPLDQIKKGKPVGGFGSTLDGFQNLVTPPIPQRVQPAPSVPNSGFHQSFNPAMEQQLKAYLLGIKKDEDNQ